MSKEAMIHGCTVVEWWQLPPLYNSTTVDHGFLTHGVSVLASS